VSIVTVGDEPGLLLEAASLRTYQRVMKRALDFVCAAMLLIATAPVLLAIATAIKINSRGPVIFKHERVGERGRSIRVWKFRTMVDGAENYASEYVVRDELTGFNLKVPDDPRITSVGRWLRKWSVDELPQLLNVLRGEMSLVGPRPVTSSESLLAGRLLVPPGMTGLWQVSGRSDAAPEVRTRLDLTYVRNWSLLLDLYIMLRTIPAIVRKHGAY
jgi:lipopolysaccharide/colanic/teichoic acid biosynthesis glycosyltransferase